MSSPENLKYTRTHEWIRLDGDVATIGITDHAQHELGDITFVDLPDVGSNVESAQPFAVVESVKAASDVYAPVDGEVVERNESVVSTPELINSSPFQDAWLVRVKVSQPSQVEALLGAADYDDFAGASAH